MRRRLADAHAQHFANGGVSKHDLIIGAACARPEVRDALKQLPPDRRYTELRQVWEDLPAVPVGI